MNYQIIQNNEPIALLNLSQDPWWETAETRYPITRLLPYIICGLCILLDTL